MPNSILPEDFLLQLKVKKLLLIDARSENEFAHAHIPGAVNIPLLNNEHRHLVGIEYKKKGREAAVALGFKLVGPHFHEFINKANELTAKKEVLIYCWRGGMRSSILAWVLSMAGFKTTLLKGGYKSFRGKVLSQFSKERKILILGGHTGSGKTEILKRLQEQGQQVVDLEGFANHKGSAFGALGQPEQPSNEYFENELGMLLMEMSPEKILWAEAESRSIGKVKIPDEFYNRLQHAPLIEIVATKEYRMKRIKEEYCSFPKEQLSACTQKLEKRLGNLRMNQALKALIEGNFDEWLDILLEYYDKTYLHSLNERNPNVKETLTLENDELQNEIIRKLILCSKRVIEKTI